MSGVCGLSCAEIGSDFGAICTVLIHSQPQIHLSKFTILNQSKPHTPTPHNRTAASGTPPTRPSSPRRARPSRPRARRRSRSSSRARRPAPGSRRTPTAPTSCRPRTWACWSPPRRRARCASRRAWKRAGGLKERSGSATPRSSTRPSTAAPRCAAALRVYILPLYYYVLLLFVCFSLLLFVL